MKNEVTLPDGSVVNPVTGQHWRKGRVWIFALVLVALLGPTLASAKGPVVDSPTYKGPVVDVKAPKK